MLVLLFQKQNMDLCMAEPMHGRAIDDVEMAVPLRFIGVLVVFNVESNFDIQTFLDFCKFWGHVLLCPSWTLLLVFTSNLVKLMFSR